MLTKELGKLDFNMPAKKIERLIRGLIPWPCAYTTIENKTAKILSAKVTDENDEKYKEDSNSTYSVKYGPDYKSANIEFSKKEEDIIALLKKDAEGENPTFYSTFCILFRTENMNNPLLCEQYNPILKETAYSINYIYTSKSIKKIPVPDFLLPDGKHAIEEDHGSRGYMGQIFKQLFICFSATCDC